jgi:hypothetical protein
VISAEFFRGFHIALILSSEASVYDNLHSIVRSPMLKSVNAPYNKLPRELTAFSENVMQAREYRWAFLMAPYQHRS